MLVARLATGAGDGAFEGVEGVGVARFTAVVAARFGEHGVDDRCEVAFDAGAGFGCAAGVEVPCPFGVGEGAHVTRLVDAPVRRFPVGVGRRFGAQALGAQLGEAGGRRGVEEPLFRGGVQGGGVGHARCLVHRDGTAADGGLCAGEMGDLFGHGERVTGCAHRRARLGGQCLRRATMPGPFPARRRFDAGGEEHLGGGGQFLDGVVGLPHPGHVVEGDGVRVEHGHHGGQRLPHLDLGSEHVFDPTKGV